MSRDPFVSPNDDAESALSDDDLDGVVGGTPISTCSHGSKTAHPHKVWIGPTASWIQCPGPQVTSSDP